MSNIKQLDIPTVLKIKQVDISLIMKSKYLDYAISVIMGRAFPDVRDGMKWVHRRIIFGMDELRLYPNTSYRKSARIVGDVLGKYHPHGDGGVYGAMVRMAQDFNLRYPLIDGHGNWGSQDGDNAAAYRYTEAKMTKITLELLKDIHKNTVDFIPNFDGEEKEPTILPCRFPNLLVNGSEGIAVGIATSIPPHNLTDSINTILYMLDNEECPISDLVDILKAPDFPTGGEIINPNDMLEMYTKGYGKVVMRSKYQIEKYGTSKQGDLQAIVVTEIPYQVNKSKLLENIFNLSNDSTKTTIVNGKKEDVVIKAKIPEINQVVDESDKTGMRISIQLKKNSDVDKVLPLLFKYSDLQCNYNSDFNAIYGTNQLLEKLTLKEIIQYYINHQKEVLTRRTQYDLDKSKRRLHILEGLIVAIVDLDKTIALIRSSKNRSEAMGKLIKNLKIDEEQSTSILALKLERLTGLELSVIQKEYNDILNTVAYLNSILDNKEQLLKVLKDELINIRNYFGDERRTELIYEDTIQDVTKIDLIEDYSTYCILTKEGYLKKLLKRTDDVNLKEGDEIIYQTPSSNKATLLLFSNKGACYKVYQHDVEECKPSKLGEYLPNILSLEKDESIISMVSTRKYSGNLINIFENGLIAKVKLESFKTETMRGKLKKALNIESKLLQMAVLEKDIDILLATSEGKVLIFNTEQLNPKDMKDTKGVVAINLGRFENNKIKGYILNVNEENGFTIKTKKNKQVSVALNELVQSATQSVDRKMFNYLSANLRTSGMFIYNCRAKNDKVTEFIIDK